MHIISRFPYVCRMMLCRHFLINFSELQHGTITLIKSSIPTPEIILKRIAATSLIAIITINIINTSPFLRG